MSLPPPAAHFLRKSSFASVGAVKVGTACGINLIQQGVMQTFIRVQADKEVVA